MENETNMKVTWSRGTSRNCPNATNRAIQYSTNGASLDASQTKRLDGEIDEHQSSPKETS